MIGIYTITNKLNNKCYLGSSTNIQRRWQQHRTELKHNKHNNKKLQNAYNKYGKHNFIYKVIEECSKENLIQREQYYLDNIDSKNLYNLLKIAGKGGSEIQRVETFVLDLHGNIVWKFESSYAAINHLQITRLDYRRLNTPSIFRFNNQRYRMVTRSFYENNFLIIKSWKNYTSNFEIKKTNIKLYEVYKQGVLKYTFKTRKECGLFLKVSVERIRQLLNSNGYHKRTGYKIVEKNIVQ
jgi:group I intron endonuclease